MNRTEIYEKLTDVSTMYSMMRASNSMTGRQPLISRTGDSLTHIMLLSAVEDEFGIRFDMKAVQGLKDVGAMVDLIAGLLV